MVVGAYTCYGPTASAKALPLARSPIRIHRQHKRRLRLADHARWTHAQQDHRADCGMSSCIRKSIHPDGLLYLGWNPAERVSDWTGAQLAQWPFFLGQHCGRTVQKARW